MSLLDRRIRRRDRWADLIEVDRLTAAWRAAAEATLGRPIDTVAGASVTAPRLVEIVLGPPTRLTVELLPGQIPADVRAVARRIAPSLGVRMLRVEVLGLRHVVLTLLARDPLDELLPLPLGPGESPGPIVLGRDEDGELLTCRPAALPHLAVQGETRSGKSRWLYGLVSQLVADPHVLLAGVDPSGLLLRPLAGTRHGGWTVCGLHDLAAVEAVLTRLVAELDTRLAAMPTHLDVLPVTAAHPLMIVLLEEWPATLRAADTADTKFGKRIRAHVARLLAESHKAGMRVVLVAQRAEANVLGGAERAQCGGRLSFRVDNADAVRLLHADAEHLAAEHAVAPAGRALISWPGRPLSRMRAPEMPSYAAFVAAVAAGGAR